MGLNDLKQLIDCGPAYQVTFNSTLSTLTPIYKSEEEKRMGRPVKTITSQKNQNVPFLVNVLQLLKFPALPQTGDDRNLPGELWLENSSPPAALIILNRNQSYDRPRQRYRVCDTSLLSQGKRSVRS